MYLSARCGLALLLAVGVTGVAVAAEGDEPCHHNKPVAGHHHEQHQMGDQPCDHEKGMGSHHKGDQPCDHKGDQPCDHEKGGMHHNKGDEPCDHNDKHAWKDSLTPEQAKKVDQMHEDLGQQRHDLRSKLHEMQQQTKQMVLEENPDFTVIRAKVDEVSKIRSELQMLHLQHIVEMRKVLNDEQRALFDKEVSDGQHDHYRK